MKKTSVGVRPSISPEYLHIMIVTELKKDELSVRILTETLPDCWLLVRY